ncbi:dicarboxylate--CoA ligase PimA [Alsobacter soli]|uniref:Dicarboxylate--CoA ligase PimA n=1 Tax=Alsobacter soli TaxID=2109933 RepID=A0A2T1HXM8_9HYPH|nr:AMP-binding protein [Alsobacter soli]PSC06328.1 dicarboxylate--CoA ligase PimA [Alsobacter soli]
MIPIVGVPAPVYPPTVDWAAPISPGRVEDLLEAACSRFADHVACWSERGAVTYADLASKADRICGGLQGEGLQPGDRVGLMLPNSVAAVAAFFGVLKAGGVVVNFNPLLAIPEITRQARDSGADTLVVLNLAAHLAVAEHLMEEGAIDRCLVADVGEMLGGLRRLIFGWSPFGGRGKIPANDPRYRRLESLGGEPTTTGRDPGDIAVLQYTGGTTGLPKGVVLTHRALHANAVQLARWFTQAEAGADKIVAVLPFFHAFGMTGAMLFGVALGAELVLLPRFDADGLISVMESRRATMLLGVPAMFRALLMRPKLAKADLSSLKVCISGGDPLDPALADAFRAATGVRVLQGYGLTECGPVVTCGSLDVPAKPASAGLPLPGTRLRIVDPSAPEIVMAAGQVGEICVAGPQVMAGYWNAPGETAAVFRDGWLRTGDLGSLDDDGYLFVVDRLKDLVSVHGRHVFPRVVEDAIRAHPSVADAAVIGPTAGAQEGRLAAFVVLRPDGRLTEQELKQFLEGRLAAFERPGHVRFMGALPKTALGKTIKAQLVAMLDENGPAAS